MELLFWLSVTLIVYTYLGYPLLISLLAALFPRPVAARRITPRVSVLLPVYNEGRWIGRKLRNLLDQDYPHDRLEILVGSDASTDGTDGIAGSLRSRRVRFFRFPVRRGKVSVLNRLAARARGEIIVFSDARQLFDRHAVRELVQSFADREVGAVAGQLVLLRGGFGGAGTALRCYWSYEKMVRRAESRWYSLAGVSGAIYAVRRGLYLPPPEHIILDDLYIPLRVVAQGYRVVLEERALAFDRVETSVRRETLRKVRTLAGNWQLAASLPRLFNPLSCPVALQLLSHKLLRVLVPYFLLAVLCLNACLLDHPGYRFLLAFQAVFYLAAAAGLIVSVRKNRLFNIPYTFCLLNINAVRGLLRYLRNAQKVTWAK